MYKDYSTFKEKDPLTSIGKIVACQLLVTSPGVSVKMKVWWRLEGQGEGIRVSLVNCARPPLSIAHFWCTGELPPPMFGLLQSPLTACYSSIAKISYSAIIFQQEIFPHQHIWHMETFLS
jgi:hypothetical protein